MIQSAVYPDSKPHYQILDGLRGVASIVVIIFHVFETFTGGNRFIQIINHGYLAVDFFFLLSGFVVAYAYDDRWGKLTQWDFYKRRLIRLQPMVVFGSIIGALFFYFSASPIVFPLIAGTPVWKVLMIMLIGATLIPVPISMDIRGWQEMHPLNGPAWSLFFEYIANILYAVLVRRFSKLLLSVFVSLAGCMMIAYLIYGSKGDLIGGWSLMVSNFLSGLPDFSILFLRVFCFVALANSFVSKTHSGGPAYLSSSHLVFHELATKNHVWMNGIYDAIAVIIFFRL